MPFQSEAQRRFMYSQHPKLAKEFEAATPENADLPEHVKKEKMAEGGVPGVTFLENVSFPEVKETIHLDETPSPNEELAAKGHEEHCADGGTIIEKEGMTLPSKKIESVEDATAILAEHAPNLLQKLMDTAKNSSIKPTLHPTGVKFEKRFADGGVVQDIDNPTQPPTQDPSEQEKRDTIYRAMGMGKYATGGIIPPAPQPTVVPNQSDPNFWENIKNALARVAGPITKPINVASNVAQAATPALVAPATAAINELAGTNLPIPETPPPASQVPSSASPTPLAAPMPKTPPPPVSVPETKTGSAQTQPSVPDLFNQDTSKLTEGVNPEDRAAVAQNLADKQTGIGSIIAQALAGLGDAISAKGGRDQQALKGLLTMQKQQRDEALANFDAERRARLEQLTLKTQMGENAIKQLAAQDAYGVDENLNRQLGAPAGTKHKDLPLFMQMAAAKAAQAEKDADLHMRATKQAADEADAAEKGAGFFHFKASPEKRQAVIEARANEIIHSAKGHLKFQPSGGQPAFWTTADGAKKAMQRDPQGQIVQ